MVLKCENCGLENEDEFKFCLGCGSKLEEPEKPEPAAQPEAVDCPNCGTEVPGGFKFCGACGTSLADLSATAEPEPESSPTVESDQSSESPAADEQPLGELTVIRPDGTEGARIPLTPEGIMLGRDSEFDVLTNDPFLSPQHAEVCYEAGSFKLRCVDEVNGVYWRLRDDVELQDGALIRIGQEVMRFNYFSNVDPLDEIDGDDEVVAKGSPDPGIWGRLALIGGPGIETRAFAISSDEITIGREVGMILFRDDGFVSGKHARIYRENGKAYLRDLGSSNGSYVRLREDLNLSDGDLVLMGQQLLRVTLEQ